MEIILVCWQVCKELCFVDILPAPFTTTPSYLALDFFKPPPPQLLLPSNFYLELKSMIFTFCPSCFFFSSTQWDWEILKNTGVFAE